MGKRKEILLNIYDWLEDRYQLENFVNFMKKKSVPIHRMSFWYYFGGIALFLFTVQVISGILLLMYYSPGPDSSYESIQFIMSKVQFGWLVRSIHSIGANLFILTIMIHMFSVFFMKAYRAPRELTWVTGMLMLFLAMGFGFSGYLLPWNELSFFATKVGTDIMGVIPVVGKFMLKLLRGSEDVTPSTIYRFFGIHVAILPTIFNAILVLHLIFIQRQGMHEPESWKHIDESKKRTMPFFPNFMLRDFILWLIVLNILALLAVFFPHELGNKADLFAPAPEGIKPEWYFLFMFQSLKLLPAKILFIDGELVGILGFSLGGLIWLLIPFIDEKSGHGLHSKIIRGLGIFILLYMIGMTIWGHFA